MIYILILVFGVLWGWFLRSFHLGRYFAGSLKSSMEFGGSEDELRTYEVALTKSVGMYPKFMRRLLWIKNHE